MVAKKKTGGEPLARFPVEFGSLSIGDIVASVSASSIDRSYLSKSREAR